MARPTLAITLAVNSACTNMTLTDSTADYGAGSITLNSVTGLVVVVTMADGTYFTYTFTIVNQVITVCTLSISGGTATTITTELVSTVWPLSVFGLFTDYGVTLPDFDDMVYTVDYTITGQTDPVDDTTAFSYTTSSTIAKTCDLCCCLSKAYQEVDPNCIDEDELFEKIMADTYAKVAVFSANVGNATRAQLALTKGIALCDCNCGCS